MPASMRVWAVTEEAATALLFFFSVCFFLLFGQGREEAGWVGRGQQRLRVFLTASATRENSNEASSPNYSPAVGFSVCVYTEGLIHIRGAHRLNSDYKKKQPPKPNGILLPFPTRHDTMLMVCVYVLLLKNLDQITYNLNMYLKKINI